MRIMKKLVYLFTCLVLCCFVSCERSEPETIIGKWQWVSSEYEYYMNGELVDKEFDDFSYEEDYITYVEFTADGVMKMIDVYEGEVTEQKMNYSQVGSEIYLQLGMNPDEQPKMIITKLTKTELQLTSEMPEAGPDGNALIAVQKMNLVRVQ